MAIVTCPNCGNQVRVQGLAAICLSCDHVVFANAVVKPESEPAESEQIVQLRDSEEEQDSIQPTDVLADVDHVNPNQVIEPAAVTRYEDLQDQILLNQQRGEKQLFRTVIALSMAGTLFLLILGIALALSWGKRSATPIAVSTATPPMPSVTPTPSIQPAPAAPIPVPSTLPRRAATTPATAPTTRTAVVVIPAGPHSQLARIVPRLPTALPSTVTDEQLGIAIKRGVQYLRSQFSGMQLAPMHKTSDDSFPGLNALATYALLHSGMTINDPDLTSQSRFMNGLLDSLTMYPMNVSFTTYSRSLRISALTILNRPQDRKTIVEDLQWIRGASMQGAYTYGLPKPKPKRLDMVWDNSNSQYGALGAWAASEAGYTLDAPYWNEVQQHWLSSQTVSGGWAYGSRESIPRLSMTAAGLNMLFVARDQLQSLNGGGTAASQPLSRSIDRALDWLSAGNNAITPGDYRSYTLYGLERAGLASGYKYFGRHDWYQELAAALLASQGQDGSWMSAPDVITETSFALLFLSRGRHPVMMSKLKFYGPWNNRPRDVNLFTRYASYQLERQLNWEVVDAEQAWPQWSDASLMLITSHQPPNLGATQIEKLRSYIDNGGLILLNAEQSSGEFDQYAANLAQGMFPDYRYEVLPADHPIYSTVFPIGGKRTLRGVSNGSRLLLVYSAEDLTNNWQAKPDPSVQIDSQIALNIAVYANGRRDLRNRLDSSFIPPPNTLPVGAIPLARIQYTGNWNPEPAGWKRAGDHLQNQTGIALNTSQVTIERLSHNQFLVAHLTGTSTFQCDDAQAESLRRFVTQGGMLLIDACGGSKEFGGSIESKLLPKLFPNIQPVRLNSNHEILTPNNAIGMQDLSQPKFRAGASAVEAGKTMWILNAGAGQIIYSPMDLSTGLSGANTADLPGYQPRYSQNFITNLMVWKLRQIPGSRIAAQ